MLRRLLLLTALVVPVTTAVASPASAATCSFAMVGDIPPPGPSAGDFTLVLGPFFVPAGSVATVQSVFSAVSQVPLPPGSTKAVVASCV
jgi:hypothetical protein